MYRNETQIRVRYAETDKMGFVYYGNYPTYYEVARIEGFRKLGISYVTMENEGIGMPVLSMSINYLSPAIHDDLLSIMLVIPEMPRGRIKFLYEIKNEAGKLLNTGETTLAFINLQTKKPVKMPIKLQNAISTFF